MAAIASRTVRFHEHGEPADVLREERTEIADPEAGGIRIRVEAVGLNPADWEVCRGFQAGALPRGIGFDVAGTVDALGEGVSGVAVGDLVFGSADVAGQPSGGLADVAIVREWFPMPDGLDAVHAATLPMVVKTAVWTLDAMAVEPGSTLLVHGAGGMVGYAAVQVALRRGVRVIATAGPALAADLEGFGALVTPYGDGMVARVRELAGGDVDLVLDTARAGAGGMEDLIALAGGEPGRVVTISNHVQARALGARVNLDMLLAGGAFPDAGILVEWAALAAAGGFRLPIARTFPLGGWREAMELSVGGAPHGKLVLLPPADAPAA
jgi:NADPH:quinone reductase-like Zn-dependent oxidoreductase